MNQQPGGEQSLAATTKGASHAALPVNAKSPEVCRNPRLDPKPLQPGTSSLQQAEFQAVQNRRTCRVAATLWRLGQGASRNQRLVRVCLTIPSDLFILRGVPAYIRSDNGPEFVAQTVRDWIAAVGASTAYIEPGSPWENGYCESFNARFRDELLNGEIFYSLKEAQILIEQWRRHYNTKRPHSALGYRPPAPETTIPMDQRPIMH